MRGIKMEGGVVVNVAVFDGSIPAEFSEYTETEAEVGVGWTDNGDGTFSPPAFVTMEGPAPE